MSVRFFRKSAWAQVSPARDLDAWVASRSRSVEYRRTTVLEGVWPSIAAVAASLPVAAMMVMLLVDTILYTVLFVYLDMVLPVGPGVKKHPLFFLKPSFWVGGKGAQEAVDSCAKPPAAGEAVEITEVLQRVREADPREGLGDRDALRPRGSPGPIDRARDRRDQRLGVPHDVLEPTRAPVPLQHRELRSVGARPLAVSEYARQLVDVAQASSEHPLHRVLG